MDWKEHGVKIVRTGEFDTNTPQTPGMTRAAAITHALAQINYGLAPWWCGLRPKPDRTITAGRLRPCSIL